MILSIRTFTIQDGKQQEAIEALVKLANYVKEHYGGDVHVERNISGPQNKVHIISERESLAAWESALQQIMADEKALEMITETQTMVVGGSDLTLVERIS